MTFHKDMLGYEIRPGDVVVYPAGRQPMIQRIARVVRSDEASGNLLVEIRSKRWARTDREKWGTYVHCLKKVAVTRLHRVMLIRQTGEAEREVFEIPARADARFLRFSRPRSRYGERRT